MYILGLVQHQITVYFTMKILINLMIYLVCSMTATKGLRNLARNGTIPALFAFGDSIVDTGNNNHLETVYRSNFPPYGRDFLGGKPTGRFGNGKIPTDLFAQALGIKELLPPFLDPNLQTQDLLTGVTFASAASGFDPLTFTTTKSIPMSSQLLMLIAYKQKLNKIVGEERTNYIISNSLFLVVAGNNDIAGSYFLNRRYTHTAASYTSFLLFKTCSFVKKLYKLGARRIAVASLFPSGCLPIVRSAGGGLHRKCVEELNRVSELFNARLSSELASLNTNLPGATVLYLDFYNPLLQIIQNYQAYGYEVEDKCCCGTGTVETGIGCNPITVTCVDDSKYVFWDSAHPAEKTYKIIISQILSSI